MVIDKICKMTVEGVKSKSESFFSISHGVLELWRKNLGGWIPPPGPDRVKLMSGVDVKNNCVITVPFLVSPSEEVDCVILGLLR